MADPTAEARIRDLERRLDLDSGSRLFVSLAEEYRKVGRFKDALSALQKGLLAHPGYIAAQVALGRVYVEANLPTDAIATFTSGGRIFAKQVPDPDRFGVIEFDADKKVISIEEKPPQPKSNFASMGLYIYDNRVKDIAKNLKPSPRGELEIVDIHKAYLALNELDVRIFSGECLDTGTPDSLLAAGNMIAEWRKQHPPLR